VARKAFDAYLINSAPLLFVVKNFAPLLINGKYSDLITLSDFFSFDQSRFSMSKYKESTARIAMYHEI
jgi:hypothetical protein